MKGGDKMELEKKEKVGVVEKALAFMRAFVLMLMFVVVLAYSKYAMAQGTSTVDLTGVNLDTASVLALAAIVLTAIGAIWGIKKLIKLANRS